MLRGEGGKWFLERQCHLSQMHSKKGNCLFQCIPGDPPLSPSVPGYLPSFFTGALPHHWAPHQPQCCPLKLQFWALLLVKLPEITPSDLPSNYSGEVFSLRAFFSVSFSLFDLSLWPGPSLSSTAPTIHFSPKSCLHTYFPLCDLFSPSSCVVYSVSPQIYFFGIHNNLIFI